MAQTDYGLLHIPVTSTVDVFLPKFSGYLPIQAAELLSHTYEYLGVYRRKKSSDLEGETAKIISVKQVVLNGLFIGSEKTVMGNEEGLERSQLYGTVYERDKLLAKVSSTKMKKSHNILLNFSKDEKFHSLPRLREVTAYVNASMQLSFIQLVLAFKGSHDYPYTKSYHTKPFVPTKNYEIAVKSDKLFILADREENYAFT